jgi:hypothetical protein
MSAVSWLVDRMHVGTSDTQVVREFARRMRDRKGWKVGKAERKLIYREALQAHHHNRQLYRDVMRGNL